LFTSAITVAEIRYRIVRLSAGRRRDTLAQAVEDLLSIPRPDPPLRFAAADAYAYADIVSHCGSLGIPIDGFDA
jgi:hypothetical protein